MKPEKQTNSILSFDIGPIIMQTKIETPENIKLVKLNQDLASIGGNILNEYIENFEKLKDRTEFEQHNEAVTYGLFELIEFF